MTAKKKPQPTVVELPALTLRDLLTPVVPLAYKDGTLPILNAVQVRAVGDRLIAVATDRFALGMQRVTPDSISGAVSAIIPLRAAKTILAMFKPTRAENPTIRLEFTADTLAVSSVGLTILGVEASIKVPLTEGDYPPVLHLIPLEAAGEVDGIALNPTYLAKFAAAQHMGEAMRLSFKAKDKVVGVAIGEDFRGAIQPLRFADDAGVSDGGWPDLIKAAQPAEKKAQAAA